MGVGYIQLLTVGSEVNIFNYNPNISFFKIYYRRHTNFFINNMEIEGNKIQIDNTNTNKIISFKIPKDGDLLGKSYIEFTLDNYFFELFGYNNNLFSTLNTNILSLQDEYYIKTNNYSISDIKKIEIIKLKYYNNNYSYIINPNLELESFVLNNNELLSLLFNTINIQLETTNDNTFYNLDFNFNFFSFIISNINDIKNNSLFIYLTTNIIYSSLNYIQIDFKSNNISFRITYVNFNYYKDIINLLLTDINLINQIKIELEYIYISCIYDTELYNLLINLFFVDIEILELEIIRDKLKSTKMIINDKFINKINLFITNKDINTTIYLAIYNGGNNSNAQITIMKNNYIFFGNLTNEYFNNLLIKNSNDLLNIFNLNNITISLKTLIRLFVSLVCYKNNISIKEYLQIVNGEKKIINFLYYLDNIDLFNDKILDNFINPNILILSNNAFYIIIYTKNVYKYFNINNYVQPFSNNIISKYSSTIIQFYLYGSIVQNFNNYLNNTCDDFYFLVSEFIFLIKYFSIGLNESLISKNTQINYINNNNLFDNVINIESNVDLVLTTLNSLNDTDILNLISSNYILLFITESLIILKLICNKTSDNIYNTDGSYTSVFNDNDQSLSVLPLTSNLYLYTNNEKNSCVINSILNNSIFFNKPLSNYIINLKNILTNTINLFLNKYKINIVNDINYNLLNLVDNSKFINIITLYYNKSTNILNDINMEYIDSYLSEIQEIDFTLIYPFLLNNLSKNNLNNIIMYNIFLYVDNSLFNNSFSNFSFNKYNTCSSPIYNTTLKIELNYLKFIFTINSPLYRLYFLFTFLSKITIDSSIYKLNILSDIDTLRNLVLIFIINILHNFNNFNSEDILISDYIKYNFSNINKQEYNLINNFIIYDQIEIFQDNKFVNLLINNNSSNYLMFYNNFYLLESKLNNIEINNVNNINNIPNICNNFKYNYDDKIILLFLQTLNNNSQYFEKFNSVYNFVLNFFNKYDFNFDNIISSFINIVSVNTDSTTNYNIILTNNQFYFKCYYSTFSIGSLFDNINLNNVNTINNIFSLTLLYNNSLELDYQYCFKNFNIKQYKNYLNVNNIISCLNFFLSELFNLLYSNNTIDYQNFNNYISVIIIYINLNSIYFYLYIISEYNFINCITIINNNIIKFNNKNNANISLTNNSTTIIYNQINFYKYNFIVIIYYYVYFIYNCLIIDIENFNEIIKNNDTQILTLNDYIILKYTSNIYYDCINELINIFTESTNNINLDFSIYYFTENDLLYFQSSNLFNTSIFTNNYKFLEFNIIENNELNLYNDKLTDNILNFSSCIYINSINNNLSNLIEVNTYFNTLYYNQTYNIITKINNLLFSLTNSNLINNTSVLPTSTLIDNFLEFKNSNYITSINIISTNIYYNLNKSYNSNIKNIVVNNYSHRICSYIFTNIKNFYEMQNYNYFYTLYYLNYNKDNINYLNQIIPYKIEISNDLIKELTSNNLDLGTFYTKYINNFILTSLIYERELNRIIYYLCTNYLIENSFNPTELRNKIYSKTLYDIVKLYESDYDIKRDNYTKKYLNYTSIYSNQSIFEIFNYENMLNNIAFSQNYWVNIIITKINTQATLDNSYYTIYLKFIKYMHFYNKYTFNLILNNGMSVLTYFEYIENYDELCSYIFDYICLNDVYSPNYIFNNIISLYKTNYISSKLNIETDNIKKKLIIYLFFSYIILTYIPELLIEYFEVNLNLVLEYNIDDTNYDVKLKNVLSTEQNIKIIRWSIYEIYNMDINEDNINLSVNKYPEFINNYLDVIEIVRYTKLLCSPIIYFNILCNKYVEDFNLVIGNNNIYTKELFLNKNFNPSITNLVSNINIIFNNDIDSNNINSYNLTLYSLSLLNIKLNSLLYDLDNIEENKSYNTSLFTFNSKNNYSKSKINDINLLLNLLCLLLGNYNITYDNLNSDITNIINNIRLGTNSLNDLLEFFKGFMSDYTISTNLISDNKASLKYNYIVSKIYNISYLTKLVSNLNNNSLITPNDYDNLVSIIDYRYAYVNFFEKYYSYNFNYNNFYLNYTVIYKKLYNYYNSIYNNTDSIKNIKNYNYNLYVWLFNNLINSYISVNYYSNTSKDPSYYIVTINEIINLYFKYNYSFRINSNITNLENLKIQNKYSEIKNYNNYNLILNYLISYYYYQLFSTEYDFEDNYKTDVILFFNTLDQSSNLNFFYKNNYLNLVFKFEIIIRYLLSKLNILYDLNIKCDDDNIEKLNSKLINYFTNIDNISNFFNQKYVNSLNNQEINFKLFNSIENSLNKIYFYKIFSETINKLIYWVNDLSYNKNLLTIWEEYFKNYNYEYYIYIDNQYRVEINTLNFCDFTFLVNNYINYILLINDGFIVLVNYEFKLIYEKIFSYVGYKNKTYIIKTDILLDLLYLKYDKIDSNDIDKIIIVDDSDDLEYKIIILIFDIFLFILNTNWGIINNNNPNYSIRSYITFYNYYYSYLDYSIKQQNKLYVEPYNFETNNNIFDELYILYYFIIIVITCQYTNLNPNYILLNKILTRANNYIRYGEEIITLDIFYNFGLYMDNLNSNIIKKNTIVNNYKDIENNTIYEALKYNVPNFNNNIYNYDSFLTQIYNNQVNQIGLSTENMLSYNSFYNIITNIISNYTSIVEYYDSDNIKILSNIYNAISENINFKTEIIKTYFAGDNNIEISTSNTNLDNLFSVENYKNKNIQITALTLIYREINNGNILNNILIILFYYICFITWSTLGIDIQNNYYNLQELYYDLTNLINKEILSYLNNKDGINIMINNFFDKLDILLFNNYNNYEFIKATEVFFNEIIHNYLPYTKNSVLNNLYNINNNLHNESNKFYNITKENNILKNINSLLYNYEKKLIKKNIIFNWKYLLGLYADFNVSLLIQNLKSINNIFNDIKIQENLVDYIINLNRGLINEYGIIKLINKMQLLFDDELISEYYDYNYKIFIDNFQNINKQKLLEDMLGINTTDNISTGLKSYIKYFYKKTYIIPVKLFFENYFNSIPLITCMYTNIKLIININNTSIYKDTYKINNLTNLEITTKLNSDFILVERDERISLCSKKIDNLIERNSYYELVKKIDDLLLSNDNIITVNYDFELNNLIKEILWTFELTIDNFILTLLKDVSIKNIFLNKNNNNTYSKNSEYDFILNTKFYIDGERRDGISNLDIKKRNSYNGITNILNPYKYNTKVKLEKYYNTYSFGLEPLLFQPSGAINMSNYKIFRIQIQIDKQKLVNYLKNFNILFNLKNLYLKIFLTTYEYNILRYQSGLGGLLFIS